MKTKIGKRVLSVILSALMVVTMVPTFTLFNPTTAEAEDVPSSAFWSILASTDFSSDSTTWSGSGSDYTVTSPTTAAGGSTMEWKIKYGTRNGDPAVVRNSNGVGFPWVTDSYRYQGFLYLSKFNDQTTNTILNGVNNFKIDLAFSFTGKAKANTGYDLKDKCNDVPLIKLANDSSYKYNFRSQYNHQSNWFLQTAWGERSIDDDDYYVDGGTTETEGTTTGGKWAITTQDNNASSVLSTNTTYHYVVYYVDKMIGSYVTDNSGNVVINYNPIEMGDTGLTPSQISSIYLGASEFNWAGKYDMENIAYKSIEIYQGNDTSTYDSTRTKYLYAYFQGDSDAGETMHYAISQDGINFEAVSGGAKVWNPSNHGATETYPTTDSAPYSDSVAISNHVRDSYAFYGTDGKDYVIATDLNTNNGSWGSVQNSRFLVWKMDYFGDIADTKPWTIDTANLPGMDDITGGTSGTHKTVKKAWAPQVIYDADVGKYMLYWSVGADGISTQVYYTYTSDLKTDFTPVKRLLYPDFDGSGITNHIDADITYHNGLYYCYFKNEDSSGTGAKRIWYSVAPHANGPYTDYELVETNYASEGPQVYETTEGSYMLMIDGFSDHTYHMYSASNPYDFSERYGGVISGRETSTNVSSLSPRHGSIIRITEEEYNKLSKLRIGEEVRYTWQTTGNYGHNSVQTDATGNQYHVTWNPDASTTTTGSGTLSLTGSGAYVDTTTAQGYVSGGQYTVTFYYKSNGSTARDDNHSIFSISKADAVENYVRLTSNGKFFVNGTQVTPSGNCSDGTTTRASKLSSAVNDTTNSHRFTITSDGLFTSLIIDGEYICATTYTDGIQNNIWITLGWARIASYENNRLTAEFGQFTIKNVATVTDKEDEFYNSLKPANVTAGIFNATVYHEDSACTGGYSNVVWCPKNMSWSGNSSPGGNNDSNVQYTNSKIAQQRQAVLAYDGVHEVSMPVVYETYCQASHSNKTDYVSSNGSVMKLTQNWTGYQDGNYTNWPGSSSGTSIGYDENHTSTYSFNNTSTHRFFWNKLFYTGTGDTTNYYETQGNLTFWSHNYKDYWGSGWNSVAMYSANTYYVINYKPVYDILNGTTKVPHTDNMTISQLYNNDATNRWMYTKESYAQALYAMKLLKECDPNLVKYTYSTDAAAAVAQCGQDIKKAVEAFNNINLVKNTFNITYRMADGTTKAEVVTAGNNLANVPSNTATYHVFDTYTHKKNCHWDSVTAGSVPIGASSYSPSATPSTSVQPKADTIYVETGTIETCGTTYVAASGDTNGYTKYDCSVCGYENDIDRDWDEPLTSAEWDTYDTKVAAITTNVADTQYTTSSRTAYETAANAAIEGVSDGDPSKSESFINGKIDDLDTAARKLNHVADFSTLDSTVTAKTATKNTNNYDGSDNQINTYASWVAFRTAYDNANTYYSKTAEQRADTPMYAVDGSGYVTATLSTDQSNINTYNNALAGATLVPVDSDLAYSTFEDAKALVTSTLDTRKYTTAGLNYVNGEIDTANGNVYKILTADEATDYNAITGDRGFTAGDRIKNTGSGATDTYTGNVLSASTTLNDPANKGTYIKKYTVTFTIQDDKDPTPTVLSGGTINGSAATSASISYGDSAELAVPSSLLSSYSITNWGAENRNDTDTATEGSQKVSGNIGSTYKKVVNGNIAVVAELSSTATVASGYRYNICDAYGRVDDVQYGSDALSTGTGIASVTINSKALTAKSIPFYEFKSWTVTYKEATKTYTIKPVYNVEQYFDFTVTGGSISNSRQKYDTRVTLSCDNANFWAWAVKKGGKYQIASYNANYFFFACANEDYVAIIKDGSTFKTTETTPVTLTSSNIDGVIAESDELDTAARNAIVADKLTNKKPFVSIQNAKMTSDGSKYTAARVYARVTTGATSSASYGLLIRSGNFPSAADMKPSSPSIQNRSITTILETGQYTYTLNSSSGFKKDVTFRAYADYDTTYTHNSTTYTINARDYSEVAIAERA